MRTLLRKLKDKGQAGLKSRDWIGQRRRIALPQEAYAVIYAIGDIHGSYAALLDAESRILRDAATLEGPKLMITLGDYVDRGPSSAKVLEHLLAEPAAGMERICLCGNHDDVFCRFLLDPIQERRWLDFGAGPTLASYGVNPETIYMQGGEMQVQAALLAAMPDRHQIFLRSLPIMVTHGRFVFVHAGLYPGRPLDEQVDEDLMWIREPFLSRGPQASLIVVHGHTPSEQVQPGKNRIGIDTAAYATGKLAVLRIMNGEVSVL